MRFLRKYMCRFPLFETIAICDGIVQNIEFHQRRFDQACRDFFQVKPFLNLAEVIIPSVEQQRGIFRCRLDYNKNEYILQYSPYKPKIIQQFKLIYTQNLEYRFKYTMRDFFQSIPLAENEEAIIINNGKVSDATIGNLLFFKQGKWLTSQHYLLKGTQLATLLETNRVELADIEVKDLSQFEKIMLINALNPFDLTRSVPIQAIDFGENSAK